MMYVPRLSSLAPRVGLAAVLGLLSILSPLGPTTPALAQQTIEEMKEMHAGDLKYRTHLYLEFASRASSQVVLLPPDGFSGGVFRTQTDGTPGWGEMLRERGYNAYMLDHVGCGATLPPPSSDITRLTEKAVWGTFQIMVATRANMVIAQGFSAGFAIKGRSMRNDGGFSFVLIDPIGPQGSQDYTSRTPVELANYQRDLSNELWRKWGWGRSAHRLRKGTDLSLDAADGLLSVYDPYQPNYPMTLLTHIEAGTSVGETMNLEKVPVLVVRTTAADAEQIRRENQVADWLVAAGCRVERLDLSTLDETKRTTGLPWAGADAATVLDLFLEWYSGLGLPTLIPLEFQY